jgi:hypothetical protein
MNAAELAASHLDGCCKIAVTLIDPGRECKVTTVLLKRTRANADLVRQQRRTNREKTSSWARSASLLQDNNDWRKIAITSTTQATCESYPFLPCPMFSLMTRQGFPTATRLARTSRTATLPAPITVLSPIVTPGQIKQPPPSQTLCPIVTGFAASSPLCRTSASIGWKAV